MTDTALPGTLPSEEDVEAAILKAAGAAAPKSVSPEEVARALTSAPSWQQLLPLIRRAAIRLTNDGRLAIHRKGKPIDPADLRGVYRLALPREEAGEA
jgi:hypothetical protein